MDWMTGWKLSTNQITIFIRVRSTNQTIYLRVIGESNYNNQLYKYKSICIHLDTTVITKNTYIWMVFLSVNHTNTHQFAYIETPPPSHTKKEKNLDGFSCQPYKYTSIGIHRDTTTIIKKKKNLGDIFFQWLKSWPNQRHNKHLYVSE